jgi:hypothetical protein
MSQLVDALNHGRFWSTKKKVNTAQWENDYGLAVLAGLITSSL